MAIWLTDFEGSLALSDPETMAEWNRVDGKDYQEVYSLRNYLNVIPRNGTDVLLTSHEGELYSVDWRVDFRIYRMICGLSVEAVEKHLAQWEPGGEFLETLNFRLRGEELCVQEAVESQANGPVPRLIFPAFAGIYEIRTYQYKPDSETWLIIHHAMRRR